MITRERRERLLFRIPLAVAILIALFWLIWYLVAGSIPTTTSIKMTETWTIVLPFAVSRLWDILFGAIWTFIIVWIATSEKIRKNEALIFGLVVGLGVGLVVLIRFIFSRRLWSAIFQWLTAKD